MYAKKRTIISSPRSKWISLRCTVYEHSLRNGLIMLHLEDWIWLYYVQIRLRRKVEKYKVQMKVSRSIGRSITWPTSTCCLYCRLRCERSLLIGKSGCSSAHVAVTWVVISYTSQLRRHSSSRRVQPTANPSSLPTPDSTSRPDSHPPTPTLPPSSHSPSLH